MLFRSPSSVKRAVVTNEFRRAELCSSAEHRHDAIDATKTKLARNNYPANWTQPQPRRRRTKPTTPLFTFNIPFIDDKFNSNVKRLLTKHNIPARLTNRRGLTLRDLTRATTPPSKACRSKNCPAPGICQRSGVIYKATCTLCGLSYIGMTRRKLHERAREHVSAARDRSPTSAFGEHYDDDHPRQAPSITFEIVSQHRDVLRLHIEEAFAIHAMQPSLNRREEHLGTGFLI